MPDKKGSTFMNMNKNFEIPPLSFKSKPTVITRRSNSIKGNQSSNHHSSCSSSMPRLTIENYVSIYISFRNFMNLWTQYKRKQLTGVHIFKFHYYNAIQMTINFKYHIIQNRPVQPREAPQRTSCKCCKITWATSFWAN